MMGYHALGISSGARGITKCDRLPFVLRQVPGKVGIALAKKILVFDFADKFAPGKLRVVDIDNERFIV